MAKQPKRYSANAEAFAKEVIDTLAKGGKVNLGKIAKNHGYSDAMAKNPAKIMETHSFKETTAPLLDRLVALRESIVDQMTKRVGTAAFSSLGMSLDGVSKQINLLTGKPTDRTEFVLPDEAKKKLKDILADNS